MVLPLPKYSVAGLFAGVGGVEVGLAQAGHHTQFLCEIDDGAAAVLSARFAGVELHRDVRTLKRLPATDVIAGGFPCQDLSQAGRTAGIGGRNSGLVDEVFRLLRRADPKWLILENVPFMLALDGGRAMQHLTGELARLGFAWAYRVVDTRSFGLPQRRQRVMLVASRTLDPRGVLLADDETEPPAASAEGRACGFYWTEGTRGLGWAVDAVPTLKGGSTIGIPSPPAIWMPTGEIVTPDIRDAERLQGFDPDWTLPAVASGICKAGRRWKLVGNAVSTPVFAWIGSRLARPAVYDASKDTVFAGTGAWPSAGWGSGGEAYIASVSRWPLRLTTPPLVTFLRFPGKPLSPRATAGFLGRTRNSTLRFPAGFIRAVEAHLARVQREPEAIAS